jgi:hypothetical protein
MARNLKKARLQPLPLENSMNNDAMDDFVLPIRTRGTLAWLRTVSDHPGAPRHTRGSTLTSGAPSTDLPGIIHDLREAARKIPLTVVVHGWDSPTARAFLEALQPLLWPEDAVWLAPRLDVRTSEADGTILLDLSRSTERRIYNNLVADLTFFCAMEPSEVEIAAGWAGRSQLAIVPATSTFADRIGEFVPIETLRL